MRVYVASQALTKDVVHTSGKYPGVHPPNAPQTKTPNDSKKDKRGLFDCGTMQRPS
jgi:hypothetical protein